MLLRCKLNHSHCLAISISITRLLLRPFFHSVHSTHSFLGRQKPWCVIFLLKSPEWLPIVHLMKYIFFSKVLKIHYWLHSIFTRASCIIIPLQNLKCIILFLRAHFWCVFPCILHQSRAMSKERAEGREEERGGGGGESGFIDICNYYFFYYNTNGIYVKFLDFEHWLDIWACKWLGW